MSSPNNIDFSLADRFHELEEERRGQGRPPPRETRTIRILAGELPIAVDESEAALLSTATGTIHDLYVYGAKLVQVAWSKIRVAGGKTEPSLQHQQVTTYNLLERFARAAQYERYSKGAKDFLPCDPPSDLASFYLSRPQWNMPTLLGVVTAPTLRADGSILEKLGYDDASGLIYDPLEASFPPIPQNPTKKDALYALKILSQPIKLYKFPTPADRAVALSGILTALTRPAYPNVPLHAIDAPTAASGKSYLVDVASVIATGHAAAVSNTGGDVKEFEKRLASMVLSGDPIIAIDNVDEQLTSSLLCQLLTQTLVNVRIFGKLDNVTLPSTAAFFVTGNNLVIVGDLTRRVLTCRIDTKSEQPELERYPFHPVEVARKFRARYAVAGLTLLRAYLVSGERVPVSPIGSYQEWSRVVREALVWLGEADPVEVITRVRRNDPRLQRVIDVLSSWANIIGLDQEVYTRELVARAYERQADEYGGDGGAFRYPFFREALLSAAPSTNNQVSPDKLGWWLRRNRGRPVHIDHHERGPMIVRIAEGSKTTQGARWFLEEIVDSSTKPENVPVLPFSDPEPSGAPPF